jgi:molecular chaperone GrpE
MEKQEKDVTLPESQYQELLKKVEELEGVREKHLRSAADYDNAKKRLAKEREEFIRFSQERLLRDLLPILDNFERAMDHAGEAESDQGGSQGVLAGVELIWKQLLNTLEAHGLKRFSSEGECFDPHLHEAVGEVREEGPEGMVAKEIVSGYRLHDRVLRPAKVKVRVSPAGKEKRPEEKEEELT